MNIPNTLTIIRILLTPLFVYLFNHPDKTMQIYAIALFFFASFTDWLDGFYARRYNVVTRFGQFMDPMADKILNLSGTYVLAMTNNIYWWIVIVVIFRDIFVTILRLYALKKNKPVITSRIAQWKTALHMLILLVMLIFIFLHQTYDINLVVLQKSYTSIFGIGWLIVAVLSIYTAIDYIIYNWSLFITIWRSILRKLRLI